MKKGRGAPGYMTEDLALREVGAAARYTSRTERAVEHILLATTQGELMGYLYANDEDDAAGCVAMAGASVTAQNLAAFWMRILLDAKRRGKKPSVALDEMMAATHASSHVVPGSRQSSASLAALKAIAAAALW